MAAVLGMLCLIYDSGYANGMEECHQEQTGAVGETTPVLEIEMDGLPPHFVIGPEFWDSVSEDIAEVELEIDGYIIGVIRPVRKESR